MTIWRCRYTTSRSRRSFAGWGPGQLETEIASGAWLCAPGSAHVAFGVDPDAMWDHVIRALGIDPVTLIPTSGVH